MISGHITPTGRLAPSPTGGLHLGHARTFLAAWSMARGQGGRVILRVEDLDTSRVRPGAVQGAIDDLRWLGLSWDEGPDVGGPSAPYVQSLRLEQYEAMLRRLRDEERVYPCTCTRAEVAHAASAPHADDEGPTYPGTCSGRSAGDAAGLSSQGRPFAWRFRVPAGEVAWDDLVQGRLSIDPVRIGGDFLVGRDALGPSYQLAVVHDDATMGVTQVVRGLDLVPSTPRQILLYRACGWTPPAFGHMPLVHAPDGRRLAKRDGSIKLSALREAGVDPVALVDWLAAGLGMTCRTGPVTPEPQREYEMLFRIPEPPTPALPHKGGGGRIEALPPCGGGLGGGSTTRTHAEPDPSHTPFQVGGLDPRRIPREPLILTEDALDALRRGRVPAAAGEG